MFSLLHFSCFFSIIFHKFSAQDTKFARNIKFIGKAIKAIGRARKYFFTFFKQNKFEVYIGQIWFN